MTSTDFEDPVEKSRAFDRDNETRGLPSLETLAHDFRRLKRTSRWLQAIGSLLVVTVLAVILLAVRANEAAEKAVRAQNAVTITCTSSNQARAAELAVWNYLLSIPPQTPQTPAQAAKVTEFKSFLNKTLAPRDCAKIAAGQSLSSASPTPLLP